MMASNVEIGLASCNDMFSFIIICSCDSFFTHQFPSSLSFTVYLDESSMHHILHGIPLPFHQLSITHSLSIYTSIYSTYTFLHVLISNDGMVVWVVALINDTMVDRVSLPTSGFMYLNEYSFPLNSKLYSIHLYNLSVLYIHLECFQPGLFVSDSLFSVPPVTASHM